MRFCRTALLVAVILRLYAPAALPQGANQQPKNDRPPRLLDSKVREFVYSGETADIVRAFARAMRVSPEGTPEEPAGVIGFENVSNVSAKELTVTVMRADVRTVLHGICRQNPGYRVVETKDPEMVNLLAADERPPGREILDFKIPRLDIEADMEAEEVITHLIYFSPELRVYLGDVFERRKAPGSSSVQSGAISGIGGSGNLQHPHFSIHLKNATVREALNAVAVESYRMWKQIGWNIPNHMPDGRVVWNKDAPHIVPRGWEFRYVEPGSMSFQEWTQEMFRFLM